MTKVASWPPPLNELIEAGCVLWANDSIEALIQNIFQLWSSDTVFSFLVINIVFISSCLSAAYCYITAALCLCLHLKDILCYGKKLKVGFCCESSWAGLDCKFFTINTLTCQYHSRLGMLFIKVKTSNTLINEVIPLALSYINAFPYRVTSSHLQHRKL